MRSFVVCLALVFGSLGAAHAERAYITSVWMSQSVAHGGDVVHGRVGTSKATASIEVRVGGYGTSLQKINDTTFVGDIHVPHLPFFMKRTYTVRVIARTISGEINDERDTSITIR